MQQSYEQITRRNPVRFYLSVLLYMLAALALRALAFAPLISLWLFPEGSQWRYLALLCPILLIFIVLPLRFSFAQALIQKAPARDFSFRKAMNFSQYGKKLGEGLLHALNVLKWGIPLAAVLGYGYYSFQDIAFSDLFSNVQTLGADMTRLYVGVLGLFTDVEALQLTGGLMEGLYTIFGIVGIAALILFLGVARNSAYRYIWAFAIREGLNPRAEARNRLHKRRFFQLVVALYNLILLSPFVIVLLRIASVVVGDVSNAAMMALSGASFQVDDLRTVIVPFLLAFFCLYFPLLPLRRIMTAYFAAKRVRRTSASDSGESVPPVVGETPVPAYVPSVSAFDKARNEPTETLRAETPVFVETPTADAEPSFVEQPALTEEPVFSTQPALTEQPALHSEPTFTDPTEFPKDPLIEGAPPSMEAFGEPLLDYRKNETAEALPREFPEQPTFSEEFTSPEDSASPVEPPIADALPIVEDYEEPRQDVDSSAFTLGQ